MCAIGTLCVRRNWAACEPSDLCSKTPLAADACLRAQSVTLVLMLLGLFFERAAFAFVGVKHSRMARVADSVGMAMAWLFLSEKDPLSILAVAVLLLRKLIYTRRRLGKAVVALASLALGCVSLLAAGGQCGNVSVKNAAGGLVLALFAPLV